MSLLSVLPVSSSFYHPFGDALLILIDIALVCVHVDGLIICPVGCCHDSVQNFTKSTVKLWTVGIFFVTQQHLGSFSNIQLSVHSLL
jgi:hypothetical protein